MGQPGRICLYFCFFSTFVSACTNDGACDGCPRILVTEIRVGLGGRTPGVVKLMVVDIFYVSALA